MIAEAPTSRTDADGNESGYGLVPSWPILAGAVAKLTPAAVRVYLVICAHGKNWIAYPGIAKIASEAGLRERAVHSAIGQLLEAKMLTVSEGGGGRGKKTTFKINPAPANSVSANSVCGEAKPCPPAQQTLSAGARPSLYEQESNKMNKKGGGKGRGGNGHVGEWHRAGTAKGLDALLRGAQA